MAEKPLAELSPELETIKHEKGECYGLCFDCPSCPPERAHSIFVPIRGESIYAAGLWTCHDERLESFTVSPSINLDRPRAPKEPEEQYAQRCTFHGFVQQGMVRW